MGMVLALGKPANCKVGLWEDLGFSSSSGITEPGGLLRPWTLSPQKIGTRNIREGQVWPLRHRHAALAGHVRPAVEDGSSAAFRRALRFGHAVVSSLGRGLWVARVDAESCSGCAVCLLFCPRDCIRMEPDSERREVAVVEESGCVGCEICVQECPWESIWMFSPEKR